MSVLSGRAFPEELGGVSLWTEQPYGWHVTGVPDIGALCSAGWPGDSFSSLLFTALSLIIELAASHAAYSYDATLAANYPYLTQHSYTTVQQHTTTRIPNYFNSPETKKIRIAAQDLSVGWPLEKSAIQTVHLRNFKGMCLLMKCHLHLGTVILFTFCSLFYS